MKSRSSNAILAVLMSITVVMSNVTSMVYAQDLGGTTPAPAGTPATVVGTSAPEASPEPTKQSPEDLAKPSLPVEPTEPVPTKALMGMVRGSMGILSEPYEFDESTGTLTIHDSWDNNNKPWNGNIAVTSATVKKVVFSASYTENFIPYNAFENYPILEEVAFDPTITITDVRDNAFRGCSSLPEFEFSAITAIGVAAFENTALAEVEAPLVGIIGMNAFKGCALLETAEFIGATAINSSAFEDCIKLATISFPNVSNIEADAFRNCDALVTISFPKVTKIGDAAFEMCDNLETVTFPQLEGIEIGRAHV